MISDASTTHHLFPLNSTSFHRKRAFTLIEILIVIAIIAVLAVLSTMAATSIRQKANHAKTMNQLKQIGVAINLYAQDYNNTYPAPTPADAQGVVGPVTWALTISRINEYLGKPAKYMHQELVAPGVRYPTPGGGFWTTEKVRLTYCATGVLFGYGPGGYPVWTEGRKLSLVANPEKAPLIFLARQRPSKDGYSYTQVPSTNQSLVSGDLAVKKPENTVLFNFDLGTMPVLMADGHIKAVAFGELKSFVKEETWRSLTRPLP